MESCSSCKPLPWLLLPRPKPAWSDGLLGESKRRDDVEDGGDSKEPNVRSGWEELDAWEVG